MASRTASLFMLSAVQEWGQPDEERVAAVQDVLDEAGFDATATTWPVFGAIWKLPCEGKDGAEATVWLKTLTDTMPRGEFNAEVDHVQRFIDERKAA